MRDLNRLRRSSTDRKIAGVAGGIGRHLDIDPTIVRVLLVVLIFFGGAGALIYGAVWLFVPEDGKDEAPIHIGDETRTILLVAALVLAGLLLIGNGWWMGFGNGWPPPILPLAVIALVVWLVLRHRGQRGGRRVSPAGGTPPQQSPGSGYLPAVAPPSTPATYGTGSSYDAGSYDTGSYDTGGYESGGTAVDTSSAVEAPSAPSAQAPAVPPTVPPAAGAPPHVPPQPPKAPKPPKPRALFGLTMAVVLLALGVVAVVEVAGTNLPWAAYPATALSVIGVALLVGAFVGRSTGLVFTGILAALVLAGAVWSPNPSFGDVRTHPVRAEAVQASYSRTAGLIMVDLTQVQNTAALDGRTLDLNMRAGEVVVRVPESLDVDVTSHADAGQLNILGNVVQGRNVVNNRSTPDTAAPDLHINVDMGFGQVRVSQP
jgi:phage shock protein PspC (stress-responsive transcriptional regulator)